MPEELVYDRIKDKIVVAEARTGIRFDKGKTKYELVPPEWVTVLAEILTMGADKYAERNWEKGMKKSRMVGSLFRHLFARLRGQRYDEESGKPHLGHVAWNALALMSYDLRGIGEDDLPEETSAKATSAINPGK